jgi:hypothetical protein
MRALSDSDLLSLWESGYGRHPLDRALLTLGAALPETRYDSLADWPLGRRNKALAELRCRCFGNRLRGWMACSRCGEQLEFEMDGRAFASEPAAEEDRPIVVNEQSFRLPTSRDLAAAATDHDPLSAAIRLVENCRLACDGPRAWSSKDLEEIGNRMAEADPLAEIRLTLHCPGCDNAWGETFDIASFLWEEIDARARRILLEVHALASAYGWREAEILSLSESRRAIYLAMVQP